MALVASQLLYMTTAQFIEIVELFEEAGILVKYLPPYSPDLMPIEASFSYVKYYLKEHDDLLQAYPDTEQVISSTSL